MRNTAMGYQARNMAAPRRRFGMGAAGQSVSWSGFISPIPGYSPDNTDQWTQYFINLVTNALAGQFSNVSVFVDPVNDLGVQTMRVSGIQTGGGDPQSIITNVVASTGTNLDPGSVQLSTGDISSAFLPTNVVPVGDDAGYVRLPPQSILGNPSINADGTVNLPPSVDQTPLPVLLALPQKGSGGGSSIPTGARGGTVPVRGGPSPILYDTGDNGTVDIIPPTPVSPLQVYTPPPIPVVVTPVAPDNLYDPANGILPSDFTNRATDSPVNAGTRVDFAVFISPIPGSVADNSDYWTQFYINGLSSALASQFANLAISFSGVDPFTGVQTAHVSGTTKTSFNTLQDVSDAIFRVIRNNAMNPDEGSVNIQTTTNAGQPVPVVVTTTTNVPLPTVPIPVVAVTNQNDPYYVPTATSGGAIGVGVPPASPDPTSVVTVGTPLTTPNLPAPTTTVTVPAGLTTPAPTSFLDSTVNILGIQIPMILLIGVGGLLLLSGSSSKR